MREKRGVSDLLYSVVMLGPHLANDTRTHTNTIDGERRKQREV